MNRALLPCPFCNGWARILVVDDNNVIHYEADYELNPDNGLGYALAHDETMTKGKDCPIATDKGAILGVNIYDNREEATGIWNKQATACEPPVKQTALSKRAKDTERGEPLFSEKISECLNMLTEAQSTYNWNQDEMDRINDLTQDYLHKLELENLSYHESAKIARSLSECRKDRRDSKNTITVLEPLIAFLNSEKGKTLFNLLREVLGATRKAENRMQERVYRYKALPEDVIQHRE